MEDNQTDFPSEAVDENPLPGQGHRFDPWSGKIPHNMEQLKSVSPCSGAWEPQLLKLVYLEPVLCSERSRCSERAVHHDSE